LRDQLVLLIVGFALTTVAGGLLGYWLQSRTWRRQEHDRRRQAQLGAAADFYEDLSRLLDRRLHRMRQLDGWLNRPNQPGDEIERLLGRYREVIDEWNDSLNRNLALAIRYFGHDTHASLEDLYRKFSTAGARIEARAREYRDGGRASPPPVTEDLRFLDVLIYDLNLRMIEAIQRGSVGIGEAAAPHAGSAARADA
jgi:hypothetical protein